MDETVRASYERALQRHHIGYERALHGHQMEYERALQQAKGEAMEEFAHVKAKVPRALKRRMFVELARREEKFNRWVATRMELWLRQIEDPAPAREEGDSPDAA